MMTNYVRIIRRQLLVDRLIPSLFCGDDFRNLELLKINILLMKGNSGYKKSIENAKIRFNNSGVPITNRRFVNDYLQAGRDLGIKFRSNELQNNGIYTNTQRAKNKKQAYSRYRETILPAFKTHCHFYWGSAFDIIFEVLISARGMGNILKFTLGTMTASDTPSTSYPNKLRPEQDNRIRSKIAKNIISFAHRHGTNSVSDSNKKFLKNRYINNRDKMRLIQDIMIVGENAFPTALFHPEVQKLQTNLIKVLNNLTK